jgi:hypothetical protein
VWRNPPIDQDYHAPSNDGTDANPICAPGSGVQRKSVDVACFVIDKSLMYSN